MVLNYNIYLQVLQYQSKRFLVHDSIYKGWKLKVKTNTSLKQVFYFKECIANKEFEDEED